jgi:nitroreductase
MPIEAIDNTPAKELTHGDLGRHPRPAQRAYLPAGPGQRGRPRADRRGRLAGPVGEHSSVGDQERAREILGVPGDHDVAYLIGIGYPADRPLKPLMKPNRLPFDEVVRHGHW